MSKQVVSQQMEMKCDACGKTKVWELVGADNNTAILQEMQEWYTVAHKVVDYRTGQLTQLMGDACGVECVPVLAVKLVLAPDTEGAIDLNALRASNFDAN
jgi:hypothetical protein